jgi:NADH-quinone oxidoreductase subunit H
MSELAIFAIDAVVKSALIIFILLTGFAYSTLLERKFIAVLQQRIGPNRLGPMGFFQPVADGLKLVFKEDIIPAGADKVIFTLAPLITSVPALIIMAVVPFGGHVNVFGHETDLGLADLNVGVLYILAVASISVYGIVLAGWSSNNKYAMMGGLRATAQMLSYELAMGLSILAPVMLVGSLSFQRLIDLQTNIWFAFIQPIAAIIFYITALAETSRAPFDLPEAEQELTAGFHSEYSGMKFAAFYMAEYMKMIAVSGIFAALFLGGYRLDIPFTDIHVHELLWGWAGPLIFFGKILASMVAFVWIRGTLPRIRYDYLMAFGWKILLPISLANVALTAVLVVFMAQSASLTGWFGLVNPVKTYCENQNGNIEKRTDDAGGQYSVCVFNDGSECEVVAFFQGACKPGD